MSDQWQDAPNGDGWWWWHGMEGTGVTDKLVTDVVRVLGGRVYWTGPDGHEDMLVVDSMPAKWLPITVPAPPPPPLPKSKTVTLTATVVHCPKAHDGKTYCAEVDVGDYRLQTVTFETQRGAIQWVRKEYGIEPSVSE
jgi:hypothetical protein